MRYIDAVNEMRRALGNDAIQLHTNVGGAPLDADREKICSRNAHHLFARSA